MFPRFLRLLLPVAFVIGACDRDVVESSDKSKAAAGKADHLGDECEDNGWYADGECDTVCDHPDPDCAKDGRQACGGESSWECEDPDTFCAYDPLTNMCGELGDDLGHCDPIPFDCPSSGIAVCGCDDVTYQNDCLAARAGTSVAYEGLCQDDVPPGAASCGSFLGETCRAHEYCHYDVVAACGVFDVPGICIERPVECPQIVDPVCACDGRTYGNECLAHAAGTSVEAFGGC